MSSLYNVFLKPHYPRFQPRPVDMQSCRDLVNWELIGHVLTRRSQLDMRTTEPSGGVWAPTLRHWQGRYYVSVGCTQRFRPKEWDITIPRGFYVSTDDIWKQGSWSEATYFDVPGIDQDLFFDDDGKVYFSAVNQIKDPNITRHGLGLASFTTEIDLATGDAIGPIRWNRWSDFGLGIAEGPHIFKKDGFYYLSTAEGGTDEGHQQWIFRSKEGPFGPWETGPEGTVNPVIFNDSHLDIRNTGHLDFIEVSGGKWWAVFLGVRPQSAGSEPSQLGRETFLAPVEWRDGWPVVNNREKITLEMKAEGVAVQQKKTRWRDNFQGPELDLGWYHLRTPLKKAYKFDSSGLNLFGGAYKITEFECPSMLLRKQTHFSMDWTVELDFHPVTVGEEAGTAIWWSQFAYASVGLRRTPKSDHEIVCRMVNEQGDFTENVANVGHETSIQFTIQARPLGYELFYTTTSAKSTEKKSSVHSLGSVSSRALTHRISGRESPNTGAHFAIYAQGASAWPCLVPAKFKYAETRVVE
ncbi:Non-reducing end alpha-L-arabinofuranosidase BoGH43A [Colletotrichum orbiculare MAFF 240422]|uniref:Non-reducing end alpha-L-arabinofuranosidase BoGH43A n=1 Tax=Colletotrichum orbiculare (strain 104-T / ATCC 96160 / CBS 514.97 / LARS 414 / MAFF 240422) TaxID=1213857 RepID=A0A484FJS1_COLOR|nr:Non-reducing end alpha-L-arabinofuranosidase BoGH43A [Colletotrichum orbiculare MAFF 240422]